MSIRKKIFLLAGVLLALFGVVVGTLATMQKFDGEQISNIVNYEQPLTRLVSEFDVSTDRYELNIMRILRLDTVGPARAPGDTSTDKQSAHRDSCARISPRSTRCSPGDRGSQLPDRGSRRTGAPRRLAEIHRPQPRRLPGGWRPDDGRARRRASATKRKPLSLGFDKYAQAFGPDLSEIRRELANLTDQRDPHGARPAAAQHLSQLRLVHRGLRRRARHQRGGIGPGGQRLASARDQRPRDRIGRRLISRSSVLTRDEVGELAMSFNRMIEELRIARADQGHVRQVRRSAPRSTN